MKVKDNLKVRVCMGFSLKIQINHYKGEVSPNNNVDYANLVESNFLETQQ